jgi:hypothetical protein
VAVVVAVVVRGMLLAAAAVVAQHLALAGQRRLAPELAAQMALLEAQLREGLAVVAAFIATNQEHIMVARVARVAT